MKKKKDPLEGMRPPKGCDWLFMCGYNLALIHVREKLEKKARRKKKS